MKVAGRVFRRLMGAEPSGEYDHEAWNFLVFVGSHFLTKLGDALTNPKTTLTWLAGTLGAASWITALLVPLRESGSMLVQVGLASGVERFRHRKWAWSLGAVLQAASIVAMGAGTLFLRGDAAGFMLLALVALFALSRSLSSVASKDVLGRTMAKPHRGRATGWAASAAGVATLMIGLAASFLGPASLSARGYAVILGGAGLLWLFAAAAFSTMREPPVEGAVHDTETRLRMLLRDRSLQRFVVARGLLLCTALSAPYYVMLGQHVTGSGPRLLAEFIVAGGAAKMLGSPVWGRMSDRSSHRVMAIGGFGGASLGVALAVVALIQGHALALVGVMPAMYFLLQLAHQAVRVGRKTYVVDMARGDRRTDYVAISNSSIALAILAVGGVASGISSWSLPAVLLFFAGMGFAGAVLSLRLATVAPGA